MGKEPEEEEWRDDPNPTPIGEKSGMICPRCHRGYDSDARFCPHDSEKLVPYFEWRNRKKPIEMG
jgi:hypothetical protein